MPNPAVPHPDACAPTSVEKTGAVPQTQIARLARKTQSLDILYEIATSLSQAGGQEQMLDGFLDVLIDLLDARGGSVRLAAGDGQMRLVASRGLAPEMGERDSARSVEVPVEHQDRVLGVFNLFLDRPLAAMGEDLPDLLVSVGRHLGLAIEKARLEGEARRLAVMEERNIIGNELHDSLAQSLIGMRLQLNVLSESLAREDFGAARYEVKGLQRAMKQASADLRSLLTDYRLKIDEGGLAQTVAKLVERFRRETGIAVFFQNECQALALSAAQEIQVYYIIQEALANIRKHASARNVRILLNNEGDLYTVLIEDDGLGMAGPEEPMPAEHAGLAIMRERTERLPGQIVIESESGEGTRIVLIFNAPPAAGTSTAAAGN